MRIIMLTDIADVFTREAGGSIYTPERIMYMCNALFTRSIISSDRKPVKVWRDDKPKEAYLSWSGCERLVNRNWKTYTKRREEILNLLWPYTKEK